MFANERIAACQIGGHASHTQQRRTLFDPQCCCCNWISRYCRDNLRGVSKPADQEIHKG